MPRAFFLIGVLSRADASPALTLVKAPCLLFLAVAGMSCNERVTLLASEPADSHTPWSDCVDASFRGHPTDSCDFEDECFTRDRCCVRDTRCEGDVLVIDTSCDAQCLETCGSDSDCTFGESYCEEGRCVACQSDFQGTCPHPWLPAAFPRNGCFELRCAPPSQCYFDDHCGHGEHCYGGHACADGCAIGDPHCCEGNFCSPPGCDPASLSCVQLGCPKGTECFAESWQEPSCFCTDTGEWSCGAPGMTSHCL